MNAPFHTAAAELLLAQADRNGPSAAADQAIAAANVHATLARVAVAQEQLDLIRRIFGLGSAPTDTNPVCDGPPRRPADADPVWVGEPLTGVEMHRTLDGGRLTSCGKQAFGGRTTTAANARQRWQARTCAGCWPVTP